MKKIFYANIDNETLGMNCISFVESPAVEKNFICFNEDEVKLNFSADNSKHIITGVAIRANKPIYRYSPTMGEYYIVFDEETIQKMVERYAEKQLLNIVDLQHDGKSVSNVVMVEMFIKDEKRGIDPIEFKDVEDKSLFVSYKINDENLWNEIVNGDKINGFSIECLIDLVPKQEFTKESTIDELIDEILNDKN